MKALLLDAGLTLLRAAPSLGGIYARVARRHGAEVDERAFERAAEAAFHAQAAEHRALGEEGMRTSDGHERICTLENIFAAPLETVLDNFTEVEHTATTHLLFGYSSEDMPKVGVSGNSARAAGSARSGV